MPGQDADGEAVLAAVAAGDAAAVGPHGGAVRGTLRRGDQAHRLNLGNRDLAHRVERAVVDLHLDVVGLERPEVDAGRYLKLVADVKRLAVRDVHAVDAYLVPL